MISNSPVSFFGALIWLCLGCGVLPAQDDAEYDNAPISYSTAESKDAVAGVLAAWQRGEIVFSGDDKAVLGQLLKALHVPEASQLLVFSKTSLQIDHIRPDNPRALYFSDLVSVGWVPGGDIEIAVFSPGLGTVFYLLEPEVLRAPLPAAHEPPRDAFTRNGDCLRCHGGLFTDRVPGMFIRSVATGANGSPRFRLGSRVVTHETPLAERWGGYYVTGVPGSLRHLGNAYTGPDAELPEHGETRRELSEFFKTGRYLAGTSDIVALVVFEHQCTVLTALTKADFLCRQRFAQQRALQAELGETVADTPNELTARVYDAACQEVLDALLFYGEAVLPEDGLSGGDAFREAFEAQARRVDGRSLRDFQLATRLFKYRCSYMVHTEAFATLHGPLRQRVLDRLKGIMLSPEPEERYAYLRGSEREVIHRILSETVAGYGN